MGSEDPLQNFFFLKAIFVQEGSSGTHFDHGQFEIKTFLFSPRSNKQNKLILKVLVDYNPLCLRVIHIYLFCSLDY